MSCPVRLAVNTNIDLERLEQLGKHSCYDCKQPLGDHPVDFRESVDPQMAFAFNLDRLRSFAA
jgi:hypothetical protein